MEDITTRVKESEEALTALLGAETPWRAWELKGPDGTGVEIQREYVQTELSFFEKQDFMNLITEFADKFISGDLGVQLKDLFGGDLRTRVQIPTEMSAEQAEEMVTENIDLIKTIINVVRKIPGLEHELFLIALGVRPNEREWALTTMRGPLVRGGLTDEQGFDILKTFIRQNAKAIRDFFSERGAELVDEFRVHVLQEETVDSTATEETDQNDGTPGGTLSSTTAPVPA